MCGFSAYSRLRVFQVLRRCPNGRCRTRTCCVCVCGGGVPAQWVMVCFLRQPSPLGGVGGILDGSVGCPPPGSSGFVCKAFLSTTLICSVRGSASNRRLRSRLRRLNQGGNDSHIHGQSGLYWCMCFVVGARPSDLRLDSCQRRAAIHTSSISGGAHAQSVGLPQAPAGRVRLGVVAECGVHAPSSGASHDVACALRPGSRFKATHLRPGQLLGASCCRQHGAKGADPPEQ